MTQPISRPPPLRYSHEHNESLHKVVESHSVTTPKAQPRAPLAGRVGPIRRPGFPELRIVIPQDDPPKKSNPGAAPPRKAMRYGVHPPRAHSFLGPHSASPGRILNPEDAEETDQHPVDKEINTMPLRRIRPGTRIVPGPAIIIEAVPPTIVSGHSDQQLPSLEVILPPGASAGIASLAERTEQWEVSNVQTSPIPLPREGRPLATRSVDHAKGATASLPSGGYKSFGTPGTAVRISPPPPRLEK